MCLYIIHFLLTVNHGKMWVQTHFLLLFVNKKYPETYILLWKGGWFWLFTHFANKKPSASPWAFYCCKMCKHRKNCECCPVSQLNVKKQRLSWIQVLNCQNCKQCLNCHKSPWFSFQLSKWQKQLCAYLHIVYVQISA